MDKLDALDGSLVLDIKPYLPELELTMQTAASAGPSGSVKMLTDYGEVGTGG